MRRQFDSIRRSFLRTAGTAITAPALAAAAHAVETGSSGQDVTERLARLEDEKALQALQRTLMRQISSCTRDVARDGRAGAVAIESSVRSLVPDAAAPAERIEITADRSSAAVHSFCTALIETAIGPACTLVDMARQQGEGMLKRACKGTLESTYVRRDGAWRLEQTAFRETDCGAA